MIEAKERRRNQQVILEQVKGLILDCGWVQGKLGHQSFGYCLTGAVERAYRLQGCREESRMSAREASWGAPDARQALRHLIRRRVGPECEGDIIDYNDTRGRTKGDILDLLDEAIRGPLDCDTEKVSNE